MPKVDESIFLVNLETRGRSMMTEIKSWEIDSDYLTTTDGFSFDCFSKDRNVVMGLEMEPVELFVNGQSQMIGRIGGSTTGETGLAVSYRGRDYLSAMVECDIDPTVTITKEMDLFAAITYVSGTVGIDTVLSESDLALRNIRTGKSIAGGAGKEFQTLKAEDVKPDFGTKQFAFLSEIVARHGATIQPANSRNAVILATPNYSQAPSYRLQRLLGERGSGNNIVRGIANTDYESFPTYTMFNGNQAAVGRVATATKANVAIGDDLAFLDWRPGDKVSFSDKVFSSQTSNSRKRNTLGKTYDTNDAASGIAQDSADIILANSHIGRRKPNEGTGDSLKWYNLLAIRDKQSRNQAQLERAAARTVGERLKGLLVYECDVQGHVDPESGAIWSVDTMVDVVDEVCNIAEPMWIASRRLRYSPTAGATTSMTLWRPGTFLL